MANGEVDAKNACATGQYGVVRMWQKSKDQMAY